MQSLSNSTLAQIVRSNYRTAAVLEKYDLDFCCRGKRTLEEACAEKQILPDVLIRELETAGLNAPVAANPAELEPSALVDHIVSTHHAYVRREAPQLMAYLEKVTAKHGSRHPELYRIFDIFQAVKAELDQHMVKEEQILFPRIQLMDRAQKEDWGSFEKNTFIHSAIQVMEHEHENAGAGLAEIRQLTDNYTPPAGACTTFQLTYASLKAFEMDLHQHVHLENYVLFPAAIRLQEQPTR